MSDTVSGRIFFPGNPWPNGHRIKTLHWGAVIRPDRGLSLEFSLESADYYEEDKKDADAAHEPEDAPEDWRSRIAWNNYHSCSIGPSMTSDSPCIPVSDGTTPFAFDQPDYSFRADPMPIDVDAVFVSGAFSIYLLGHDAVADHAITLTRTDAAGHYDLLWTGKIALAYVGETAFRYGFEARASGVRFDAINLIYFDPDKKGKDSAPNPRDVIARYVTDPDRFDFERRNGVLHAVRRYG